MPAEVGLPLPVLLSRTYAHLAAEAEARAGTGSDVPSLAVWSGLLRCVADVGPEPLHERDLPAASRLSKRMAAAAVTGAARRGWIAAEGGRGRRRLALTEAGLEAATRWPPALAVHDEDESLRGLRGPLTALVEQLPFELPHAPAGYGAADPDAFGGPCVQNAPRDGGLPAHGDDWGPVHRSGGDLLALPLAALTSQGLVAFTADYEDRFPWPLASTTNVLVHIRPEPRPLADIPGDHGITGKGTSLLERHEIALVTTDPADRRRKLVALTSRGVQVLQHHSKRLATVEAAWRERYGTEVVDRVRAALEPVAASVSGPDHVVATLHEG